MKFSLNSSVSPNHKEVMMDTRSWIFASVLAAVAGYAIVRDFESRQYRIQAANLAYDNSMLLGEINIIEKQPNYNDGYRDAIIKMGGPQGPGSFQDGWDAAIRVLGDGSYTTGYHTAIKQFGYTKEGNTRWLVEEAMPVKNTQQDQKPKK